MRDANFEKGLRKKLENHSSPMNLESEWAALETRRSTKKKKPLGWIWFGMAVVLFGVFIGLNNMDIAATKTIDSANVDSLFMENQSIISSSLEGAETISQSKDKFQSFEKAENHSATATSSKLTAQKSLAKSIDLKSKPKVLPAADNEINAHSIKNTLHLSSINEYEVIAQLPENHKTYTISTIATKPFTLLLRPVPVLAYQIENPDKFRKKKGLKWAIGLKTGYGKTFRQLKAVNADTHTLIDRRNNAETALDSWNTSLDLRRMVDQNWFAEVSLGYSQSTDRFQDVNVSTANEQLFDQVISIIYKKDGTEEITLGDVMAETTTTTKGTYYHFNQNAFLQLAIGHKFSFNQHFGSELSAGVNYSLFSRKKGKVFSANAPNSYHNLSDSNYRKYGLINVVIQAEIYYRMTNHWEVSIGMQGTGALNSSFINSSGISEKRKVANLQVGLRKYLGLKN